jgi:hypothetical protein
VLNRRRSSLAPNLATSPRRIVRVRYRATPLSAWRARTSSFVVLSFAVVLIECCCCCFVVVVVVVVVVGIVTTSALLVEMASKETGVAPRRDASASGSIDQGVFYASKVSRKNFS